MSGAAPLWLGKGLVLGLSIAAPVGPIGVLCIRRSLTDGARRGLAVGLGAATADAFYGAVAAFGLSAVASVLIGCRLWLQLAGGAFLLYLGVKAWRSAPPLVPTVKGPRRGPGWAATYVSAVGLTLTNPLTILSFIAVFAGFGLAGAPGHAAASLLVAGVFLGSTAWWIILSSAAAAFSRRLGSRATEFIARGSALVLMGFGIFALLSALKH